MTQRERDAVAYLDSLQSSGIRPGLDRVRAVLRAAGHPERAYASIIVAGTNGKGSTSAMLASILTASGYRTAHYTSPHLVELRERWMIDSAMIEPDALADAVDAMKRAADAASIVPTYFEALTIVAFIAFATARVDVAVLEVGMGGRLDATNVVKPLAAVITPIGMDHMEFLGNTLRKIAREKAGVIHRGAIAVTSNDDPIVLDVLRRRPAELLIEHGEHDTPLAGPFQRRNAALAVRAARELMQRLPRITEESIARGAAQTRWRGRLEEFAVAGKRVWVDGGHNAHAARAIAPFLDATVPRPRTLVFGIMRDKDARDVAGILFPLFDHLIFTEPYPPRSMSTDELRALHDGDAEPQPERAIARALASDARGVVIAGSLYLAGTAIAELDRRRGEEHETR